MNGDCADGKARFLWVVLYYGKKSPSGNKVFPSRKTITGKSMFLEYVSPSHAGRCDDGNVLRRYNARFRDRQISRLYAGGIWSGLYCGSGRRAGQRVYVCEAGQNTGLRTGLTRIARGDRFWPSWHDLLSFLREKQTKTPANE